MLTEGNFTRDEWNNLLHLFSISHFSSTCCTKIFSFISCSTMAKRIQDQKEEERVVSKSATILSFIATSSSTASTPIASKSPGMPIVSNKPDRKMSIEPSSFDAASTSQRVHGKAAGTSRIKKKKIQKTQTILRLRSGTTMVNPLPKTIKNGSNTLAHGASSSVDKKSQKDTEATWKHYLQISPNTPFCGSRLFHGQDSPWKTTWRSYKRFVCEFGYLANVREYRSSSSGSSRKRLWQELKICKELSLEHNGTVFQRNRSWPVVRQKPLA